MELFENLKGLSERIVQQKSVVLTEEATKHSFVMPFLSALGYDVFDPTVVVPEFVADIGIKKGEKVDYAILQNGDPVILVEVKNHTENLDNHDNQLLRYFAVTSAKFAVLTNGIEYRFFTDIDETNRMDSNPFLVIDMENLVERDLRFLIKFTKGDLNLESIVSTASRRKYIRGIKGILKEEMVSPSEDFVRFLTSKILPGRRITQTVISEFKDYVGASLIETINDLANEKLDAVRVGMEAELGHEPDESETVEDDRIVTTEEELQGFRIVSSMLAEDCSLDDIGRKDYIGHFVVYYKGARSWLCKFFFDRTPKEVIFPSRDKGEIKYTINKLEELYEYRLNLQEALNLYK